MILDRRLPSAVTPGPRSSKLAREAAVNYRYFACPGPQASEIQLIVRIEEGTACTDRHNLARLIRGNPLAQVIAAAA
jgi:hypothetical protein